MDRLAFEHHLQSPLGLGQLEDAAHRGSAGGAPCGDTVELRVDLESGSIRAGFDAEGCGALIAAASAAVGLVNGVDPISAGRVSVGMVSAEAGGLSASKIHAAELVVDAFHRALGSCVAGLQNPIEPVEGRRLVAMSGGVDSSVAAALAAQRGEAIGVTLELWRDEATDARSSCCSHVAVRRARSMAHGAGLAHFTLDLREDFRQGVVDPWIRGYELGETPNPCVRCNGEVRIAPMVELARLLGAQSLVTGHYARLTEGGESGPLLVAGADSGKDQAYALARVPANVLARMEFPLGGMRKAQVRELASELGLQSASVPDSQDLCFLAGTGVDAFLRRHGDIVDRPGPIIDPEGSVLGSHRGVHRHTVGQRKGLGIGGGTPLYVVDSDAALNTVTVAPRSRLATTRVVVDGLDLRASSSRVSSVRLRHRAPVAGARLGSIEGDRAVIELESPLDRVANGQMACLLDGDVVIGSATVRECSA